MKRFTRDEIAQRVARDIPADWACPECGVAKADFEMVEITV